MEYCSIEDAFPNQNNVEARRQERKKAKRCKGPQQAFIEAQDPPTDPDRPSIVRQKVLPAMNNEPYRDMTNYNPNNSVIPKVSPTYKGVEEDNTVPSFFGKDPADSFANFSHSTNDPTEYTLSQGLTNATGTSATASSSAPFSPSFNESGTLGAAGATSDTLPIPSVRDVWKPLTPSGAHTAFFNGLPSPSGSYPSLFQSTSSSSNQQSTSFDKSLHAKIDKIFSRLEQLESSRTTDTSNAQTEVLLFIMSGIFVLFLTDLAVRKGSR